MKARPILFSSPMIRALLEGSKTQTRRVLKVQPDCEGLAFHRVLKEWHDTLGRVYRCPYGQVGDLLYVRENMKEDCAGSISFAQYSADNVTTQHEWWKPINHCPSIHHPRRLSRLTLKITNVRVERVQDISGWDALAEGLCRVTKDDGRTWKCGIPDRDGLPGNDDDGWQWQDWRISPVDAYEHLWNSINNNWNDNPWVWAVEFVAINKNVDEVLADA